VHAHKHQALYYSHQPKYLPHYCGSVLASCKLRHLTLVKSQSYPLSFSLIILPHPLYVYLEMNVSFSQTKKPAKRPVFYIPVIIQCAVFRMNDYGCSNITKITSYRPCHPFRPYQALQVRHLLVALQQSLLQ